MAQGTNKKMQLEIRREIMESVRPVFECMTCKAFPTIESVKDSCKYIPGAYLGGNSKPQPKCRNGHETGKSITISNLKRDGLEWQIKLLKSVNSNSTLAVHSPKL